MKKIILASSSPRRKELLMGVVDEFEIIAPKCKEVSSGFPQLVAIKNAQLKAYKLLENPNLNEAIVIACDTVVAKGNVIFGKPKDKEQAKEILTHLKGSWHSVISGLYIKADKEYYYSVCSEVFIKSLTDNQIDEYIENYQPYDKAGSYGIQDNMIVEKYKGDYNNIVGLPIIRLIEILRENGVDVKK